MSIGGADFGLAVANKMIDTGFNTINKAIDYNFNKKLMYKQQRFVTQMYNQQLKDKLKYDDPTYTTSRLKASGLNPYLLQGGNGFGSMDFTTPSAPSGGNIGGYGTNTLGMQDIALKRAQIENVEADTEKKKKEADKLGTEISLNEITMGNLDDIQKTQIYKMESDISNIITNTSLQFMTTQKVEKEIEELNKIIDRTIAETKVKEEEAKNIRADTYCKYVYARLEARKVNVAEMNVKLAEYGVQLTKDGLQLNKDKFEWNKSVQAVELELEKEMQKHNINLDWAKFAVNTIKTGVETAGAIISKGALKIPKPQTTETYEYEGNNKVPTKRTYKRTRDSVNGE